MAIERNEIEYNEEITAYMIIKAILALIYSDDFNNDLEYVNDIIPIDSDLALELLNTTLESFKTYMDQDSRDNVSNLIMFYRNVADKLPREEKAIYYGLANETLSILRECNDSEMADFIVTQCTKRLYTKEMMTNLTKELIRGNTETYQSLKTAFMDDLVLLMNHSTLITEEEFDRDMDIYTSLDNDYISSMSTILTEMPVLFEDETFYSRVLKVSNLLGEKIKKAHNKDVDHVSLRSLRKVYKDYKKYVLENGRK